MTNKDTKAPATKADLLSLKDELKQEIKDLYQANEKWKDEILDHQKAWKDEILHHFDLVMENYQADIVGAFGDRLQWLRDVQQAHGKRLNRLEATVGLKSW